jgi:hypothetical protein
MQLPYAAEFGASKNLFSLYVIHEINVLWDSFEWLTRWTAWILNPINTGTTPQPQNGSFSGPETGTRITSAVALVGPLSMFVDQSTPSIRFILKNQSKI